MPCSIVTWLAASGAVLSYQLVVDETLQINTATTSAIVCNLDDGQVHTLAVRAVGATSNGAWAYNEGTLDELKMPLPSPPPIETPTSIPGPSPTATATQTATPSATPTPTPTVTPTAAPTPWPRPPDAICADFDADGVVGFSDYGKLVSELWGKKNDGVKEIE